MAPAVTCPQNTTADLPRDEIARWYRDHQHWLMQWLSHRLSSQQDAADVVQDTFVRVFGKWRREGAPHHAREPRALLVTVAKGILIDQWRRQDVERACLDALSLVSPQEYPDPQAWLQAVELLCRLRQVLDTLPERAQKVFLLAQVDGLPGREIAQHVGVSVATVERDLAAAWRACLATAQREGWM